MSTYTQILYHLVFSTKDRQPVLSDSRRNELYMYASGVIKNNHCRPVWVNGVKDHVHVLFSLHPTIALASLVKEIKVASSIWIKENHVFSNFFAWQESYGAFTYSLDRGPELIAYVKMQEEHHQRTTFLEEYRKLLLDHGMQFDERYLP
jgi:putative transposase